MADDGDRVNVISPITGRVVSVARVDYDSARQQGFAPATPEQVKTAKLREEYSGPGSAAAALGTGLLQGATGVSDLAIRGLGGGEALKAYESLYPELRFVGKGAGFLGTTLLTGGTRGAAGAALEGATMLPRLTIRAGEAVEGLVGGAGALRAIGGMTARGATEGALFGLQEGLSQAAVTDGPLTGEKVAASLLHGAKEGALWGAGGGFAVGVIGTGASAIGRGLSKAADAGIDAMDGTVSALMGQERGAFKKLWRPYDQFGGQRGYEVASKAQELLSEEGRRSADGIADMMGAQWELSMTNRGLGKVKQLDRLIRPGAEAEQAMATNAALQATMDDLQQIIDDPLTNSLKARNAAKQIHKKVEATWYKLYEAAQKQEKRLGTKAFHWADEAKGFIDDYSAKLTQGTGVTRDTIAGANSIRNSRQHLKGFLEDYNVWGDAAGYQKAMNEATSAFLEGGKYDSMVGKFFKRGADGRLELKKKDWAAFLRNAEKDSQIDVHEFVTEMIERTGNYADAIGRHVQLSSGEQATLKRMLAGREATGEAMDRASTLADLHDTFRTMGRSNDTTALIGGYMGGAIGGVPGMFAAGAIQAISNPTMLMRRAAAVRQLARTVDTSVGQGVKRFFSSAPKTAMATLPKLAEPLTRSRRARFETRREQLLAMDTRMTRAFAEQQLGALGTAAPASTLAAINQMVKVDDYLRGKMPVEIPGALRPRPLSQTEIDKFLRVDEVARDPLKIPDLLNERRLKRDHIETVKALWPELFKDMQEKAMDEFSKLKAQKKSMLYRDRLQLGVLLDIPTDPTLQPGVVQMLQAGYAESPTKTSPAGIVKGGGARRMKQPELSRGFTSGSESLAMKEAQE